MSDQVEDEIVAQREPFFKVPAIILLLLLPMVAIQLYVQSIPDAAKEQIYLTFGFVPSHLENLHPKTPADYWNIAWPFVSHGFLHGNWAHLGFNGAFLLAFGTPLARRLGSAGFLGFYLVCGVFAGLAHWALNVGSPYPVVGASGAIAGCMAGALRILFSRSGRFFLNKGPAIGQLAPLWDRQLLVFTAFWIVINGVMAFNLLPMPGAQGATIAWGAHIGGYFAGLFLVPLFDAFSGGRTRGFPSL